MRVVTSARRLLERAPGPEAQAVTVRLDNLMALIRLAQEKPREAQQWAQRAAEGARRIDDLSSLGSALLAWGHASWQGGLPDPGERIQEALEIYRECEELYGEAVARANLGVLAFDAGRWTEALDWYQSSRDVGLRARMDFPAAETDLNIAEILIHQGRLDEAQSVLVSAIRVLRASGIESAAVFGDQLLARLLMRRGELDEADRLAAEVIEQSAALGSQLSAAEGSLLRAQVALNRDAPLDALALLADAEGAADAVAVALAAEIHLIRADALRRLGRVDQARETIDAGLESARSQELLFEEARLLELRASLAADRDLADADAARARELLDEMGVRA